MNMSEGFSGIRILVVDDEEPLRSVVSSGLERRGFEVVMAESGKSALRLIEQQSVQLIISDIRMANGDGLFLLEQVRQQDPHHPPLIFMTGFSDIGIEDCMKRGASGVILKPFGREKLLDVVLSVLKLPKN